VQLGIRSCKPGNYELAGFPLGTCHAPDADGFPHHCGDTDEPACDIILQVALGIKSCKSGNYEQIGIPLGTCRALDADGYPLGCGDLDEPACNVILQVQLLIGPCKPGLLDALGTCTIPPLDEDSFPFACGDRDEQACNIILQLALGIGPCKPGLYEELGFPLGTCRWAGIPEPELGTNVTVRVTAPDEPISGIADIHNHLFTNEGIGGRVLWGKPFHKYGVAAALQNCTRFHGLLGVLDLPSKPVDEELLHLNDGWPHFDRDGPSGKDVFGLPIPDGWPRWDSITHQQEYYRWLERAHRGGLRLLVQLAVSNGVLCRLTRAHAPGYSCDDMEAVDRQIAKARELVQYIDDRSGGPDRGWLQIAESPAQAREIIASGKLAMVLGIEVDSLFGCKVGECNEADVLSSLEHYRSLGVRHLFAVHAFDNAFTGTALYMPFFTVGNHLINGEFLDATACSELGVTGIQYNANDAVSVIVAALGLREFPVYAPSTSGHCNPRGLTPLGDYLIQQMISHQMIIDVDHLSAIAKNRVLDIAEAANYPVVASHVWPLAAYKGKLRTELLTTDAQMRRIRDLGGLVAPINHQHDSADHAANLSFVDDDCNQSSKAWATLPSRCAMAPTSTPYPWAATSMASFTSPRRASAARPAPITRRRRRSRTTPSGIPSRLTMRREPSIGSRPATAHST
jgi:microsomal dipeptidase-like Zn-dependent dipeptidase